MNLAFANPAWLLAALVAVPLLAHLFSRARPRRRDFPSLKLLREAMRRVTSVRKPCDRWLLVVRTLAMAALIGAFLQPLLLSRFASKDGVEKTTVLVVDVSASMAYADGTRTRLAQATAAAEDVLATLPVNSRANIIWLRAHAVAELPEPGMNLGFLRDALRKTTVRSEAGDIAGAFALAAKQLESASGERELVVLSDFQKSAWRTVNWAMPSSIRVTRIAVGDSQAANVGLAGLVLEPARPVAGQEARMVCRVRNFSADARRVTVFGEAGESRISQTVELAPWSEALAMMPVKFPVEGTVALKASLGEDRFPSDDVRYALADVRGALQVAIVGTGPVAQTWLRAAQSLDAVVARQSSLADATADVVFVAGWRGEDVAPLLQRGSAVVVQPAEGLDAAMLAKLLGQESPASPLAAETKDAPGWNLQIAAEEHTVFSLFAGGAYGDPSAGKFRRRVVTPQFLKGTTLLKFDDGNPALMLIDGRRLSWWNLDLGASDWMTRTAFLPFFGEFLRHVAAGVVAPSSHEFDPGEPLRLDAASLDPATIKLVDEREQAVALAAENTRKPGGLATAADIAPGSYRWMTQDGVLDRAVVNFPETESDLRTLTTAELEKGAGALITGSARERLGDLREGRPLWPWFLAAAAVLFVIEGVLLRFFKITAGPATNAMERKEMAEV